MKKTQKKKHYILSETTTIRKSRTRRALHSAPACAPTNSIAVDDPTAAHDSLLADLVFTQAAFTPAADDDEVDDDASVCSDVEADNSSPQRHRGDVERAAWCSLRVDLEEAYTRNLCSNAADILRGISAAQLALQQRHDSLSCMCPICEQPTSSQGPPISVWVLTTDAPLRLNVTRQICETCKVRMQCPGLHVAIPHCIAVSNSLILVQVTVNVRPLQLNSMPSTAKTGWSLWGANSVGRQPVWWGVGVLQLFDCLLTGLRHVGVERFCSVLRRNWEANCPHLLEGLPSAGTLRLGFAHASEEYQACCEAMWPCCEAMRHLSIYLGPVNSLF